VTWFAESNGIPPKTEGWVKFQVQDDTFAQLSDTILIYWDNPFVGNTFFGYTTSSQDDLDPRVLWEASCGDDVFPTLENNKPQVNFFFTIFRSS
jgi:hypothetical protein